ncbi:putative E3 ubiquitin-protein ligase HTD2 [Allomyces arbusculus]|nr:putative E3 ubiquitin-protein ligase HTD2 [Allomyces arbusculus]
MPSNSLQAHDDVQPVTFRSASTAASSNPVAPNSSDPTSSTPSNFFAASTSVDDSKKRGSDDALEGPNGGEDLVEPKIVALIQQYYVQLTSSCGKLDIDTHSPLCGRYPDVDSPVNAAAARIAIVLGTLGPSYLCRSSCSVAESPPGQLLGVDDDLSHLLGASTVRVPPCFRVGWRQYTDGDVSRIVRQWVTHHELDDLDANRDASPWAAFSSPRALAEWIGQFTPSILRGTRIAIPGLDLARLSSLAQTVSAAWDDHVRAWTDLVALYHLGLEVVDADVIPVLLSYFFLWQDDEDDNVGNKRRGSMPRQISSREFHLVLAPKHLTAAVCDLFCRIPSELVPDVAQWILHDRGVPSRAHGADAMRRLVMVVHDVIGSRYRLQMGDDATDSDLVNAVKTMAMLYHISQTYDILPTSVFYNPDINTSFNLRTDYAKWKSLRAADLSLAAFPFLLSPTTKAALLKLDAVVTMRAEVKAAQYQTLFVGVRAPYLELSVRRDRVVRDTLVQLASVPAAELRKQLKVQFVDEVAVDAGGVQKEWLHLVMRNVVAPEYGMFVPAANHGVWFRPWVGTPVPKEVLEEYELIGKLVGLAVFHSILINVPFPLALYKKLANERVTLADLTEIDPDLGKGLADLAAYAGDDLEDVYCRNFTVDVPTQPGCTVTVLLVPDGANVALTHANRMEYIAQAVEFYLHRAIEVPFRAFRRGFEMVTRAVRVRKLFTASEMQALITGDDVLNYHALEERTTYDGFMPDSPVVRWFWSVVRDLDTAQQRQLLQFVTGSDRAPVGGLAHLPFVIVRAGTDSDRLPSAHVCFNALLLPEYAERDTLRQKLLAAIANGEGFGLR